mgnify:CR=1 FL=1
MEKLIENILVDIKKNDKEILSYSMLSLAFLGDSIHSAFVRGKLVDDKTYKVKQLHSISTKFVKASSQSFVIEKLQEKSIERDKQRNVEEEKSDVYFRPSEIARKYKIQKQQLQSKAHMLW